jgi:hypothetical protein
MQLANLGIILIVRILKVRRTMRMVMAVAGSPVIELRPLTIQMGCCP